MSLMFIGMLVLLIGAAMISSTEVAFFSMDKKSLELLELRNHKTGKTIKKLLENPEKLLATILITNSFFHISFVFVSTAFIGNLDSIGIANVIPTVVQIIVISTLLILFGEIIPKVLATKKGDKIALFMATPMSFLITVLKPFSAFLLLFSSKKKKEQKIKNISVDELSAVHDLIQNEEASEQEQKILSGILSFGNTDVKQIMTARTNIISLNENLSLPAVVKEIQTSEFSRIPVHKDNIDKITGVIYVKDLLPYLNEGENFDWKKLERPPFFVPESKKIDDLLKEFQEMKMHMAIVVDEYGGTSGIITLEDIIEEIVGDLSDEYDDEDVVYSKLDDKNYIFDGKTLLIDMYRILEVDEEAFEAAKGEADTIAGFILEQTGVFPKKDAVIEFAGIRFKIDSMDKRRIVSIKATMPPDSK
ncbi:MAG: gliding motility-associated protein GldE [Flavobacteriales bacterium]